jgi:hypothetical protein
MVRMDTPIYHHRDRNEILAARERSTAVQQTQIGKLLAFHNKVLDRDKGRCILGLRRDPWKTRT